MENMKKARIAMMILKKGILSTFYIRYQLHDFRSQYFINAKYYSNFTHSTMKSST